MWLTAVRSDGQPQSTPVWFLWDGSSFLMYSQPSAPKVRNIRANSKVSLHLSDDGLGEDVAIFEGTAEIIGEGIKEHEGAYVKKYRTRIADLGYEIERFAHEYSTAIRIAPTRARMW